MQYNPALSSIKLNNFPDNGEYKRKIKNFTISGELISSIHHQSVTIVSSDFFIAADWLDEFVGDNWIWHTFLIEPFTIIWFVNDDDALLFKLRFNTA